MKKMNIGDKVRNIDSPNVIRQITEVRDTGYTWIYPDIPDKDFWSENSSDPFFKFNWEVFK